MTQRVRLYAPGTDLDGHELDLTDGTIHEVLDPTTAAPQHFRPSGHRGRDGTPIWHRVDGPQFPGF